MSSARPMDDDSVQRALRAELLAAFARRRHGLHHTLLGQSPARAAQFARDLACDVGAALYLVRLEPWLRGGNNPLEALAPYAHVVRFGGRPALILVTDGEALMATEHRAWRDDPLGARLVRRILLGSPAPTLWWASQPGALPPEVTVHCTGVALTDGPVFESLPAVDALCAQLLATAPRDHGREGA